MSARSEAERLVILLGKAVIAGKAVVRVDAVAEIVRHPVLKVDQPVKFVIVNGFDMHMGRMAAKGRQQILRRRAGKLGRMDQVAQKRRGRSRDTTRATPSAGMVRQNPSS